MPPKKAKRADDGGGGVTSVRKQRNVSTKEFSTAELHIRFERHIKNAQDAYLRGDNATAEHEATLALRIRPTPQLFALLSVIAESKGQFDRSSDFRLLQAFLARDAALWEELLHDFLSQQLFYKSVVCLRRLSALETDPRRYRALQLQLADLLIGLGEIRAATSVLVPLWNSSKCKDFEVFALLSSLYFQLGKWGSLEMLIASSLKNSFHLTMSAADPAARATGRLEQESEERLAAVKVEDSGEAGTEAKRAARKHVSKRVRFYEAIGAETVTEAGEGESAGVAVDGGSGGSAAPAGREGGPQSGGVVDEFDFGELEARQTAEAASASPQSALGGRGGSDTASTPSSRGAPLFYGETVDLATPSQKRDFLTLINVYTEFLNERSRFRETIQLVEFAAAALQVGMLELPPDVLVRLGTAYIFTEGAEARRMGWDVFHSLLDTCRMDEYGDVLLDAATSLQSVSMHTEALVIFERFKGYYTLSLRDAAGRLAQAKERERAVAAEVRPTTPAEGAIAQVASRRLVEVRERVAELQAEHDEMKTVMAAVCFGAANSLFSLQRVGEAEGEARRALEADPSHLKTRLLLGKIHFFHYHDVRAAIEVLTPRDGEPALHRIQLGAALVRVFFKSKMYVEAIALGVTIFEIILTSSEDGDAESVAPGSSRRSAAGTALLMPTMSRASSAIIPASSLVHHMALHGVGGGAGTGTVGRLTTSIAASIVAGTSVYRQQMARVGRSALTTTVYGASAAASVASGLARENVAGLKDSATIFRFHRRRGPRWARRAKAGDGLTPSGGAVGSQEESGEEGDGGPAAAEAEAEQRRQARRTAIATQTVGSFWVLPEDADEAGVGGERGVEGCPVVRETAVAVTKDAVKAEEPPGEAPATPTPADARTPAAPPRRASGRTRKRSRPDDGAEPVVPDHVSTAGDKEHDLRDLEAFESAVAAGNAQGKDDAPAPESYELPTLEEVSRRFNDPAVAELFLEASANEAERREAGAAAGQVGAGLVGVGGPPIVTGDVFVQQQQQQQSAASLSQPQGFGGSSALDRVTLQEAVSALGHMEFMNLTVAIVESYSMLDKFTEAKEFAYVALSRIAGRRYFTRMGSALERPLRLAVLRAAMAAGESEDAFRVGLRLLQDDQTDEERNVVIELMHGVLNLCEDRTSILNRTFVEGACDVALLVLLGNRYHQTRSYTRVLNLYLAALQQRPTDIFLNLMVGLCYLFCSHQKVTKPREAAVSAGVYYLTQYQALLMAVDPTRTGEALYNTARAMHFLRLHYLCIPLYKRIANDLDVPSQCSLAVRRAAQTNLYYIYMWESENRRLALSMLPHAGEWKG